MTVKVEYWALGRIRPTATNARTHDQQQVEKIAQSIRSFGFVNPLLIGPEGELIAGHGRLLAADLLGLDENEIAQSSDPQRISTHGQPPESVQSNVAAMERVRAQRRAANDRTENRMDTERYLVIVFADRSHREAALRGLGLPEDERYLSADGVVLRLKTTRVAALLDSDGRATHAADARNSGAGG